MRAEIDQSGKFEDLNTHTVVSLANHSSGSIYMTSSEKIKLVQHLRTTLVNRSDLIVSMFSSFVYILIIKFGKKISKIEIDEEYTGREKLIIETVNKLFIRNKVKRNMVISFTRVGKSSPAHKLAWNIHRKKLKNKALVLNCGMILRLWGIK